MNRFSYCLTISYILLTCFGMSACVTTAPLQNEMKSVEEVTIDPFHLEILNPEANQIIITEPNIAVVGRTRIDALVTINDTIVDIGIDGEFRKVIPLEIGPNIVEIVASTESDEESSRVFSVIYTPQ